MKKTIIALVCAAAIPAAVLAAGDDWPPGPRGPNLERMAERLNLSDEQREQMRALFEEQRSDREAARERMRARMAEVLTPEQQAQMLEMREQRGPRFGGRHHRGPGDCYRQGPRAG